MPSLHIHIPYPTSLPGKTGKRRLGVSAHALMYVPRKLDHPTINLNPSHPALYDHNVRPSQTDRQTNEHHSNSATIRFDEHIVR